MNVLRALTKIAFNQLGYDVRRVARPGTRSTARPGADPITFEYLPRERGHALFEVPIADVRAFQPLGLPLRDECHPFVVALRLAMDANSPAACRDRIERILTSYYDSVRPVDAAELIDLSPSEAPGLAGLAAAGYIMPWSLKSIEETRICRQSTLR